MTLQLVSMLSSIPPDPTPPRAASPRQRWEGEAQRLRDLPAALNRTAAPRSEDVWPSVHCTVTKLFLKLQNTGGERRPRVGLDSNLNFSAVWPYTAVLASLGLLLIHWEMAINMQDCSEDQAPGKQDVLNKHSLVPFSVILQPAF